MAKHVLDKPSDRGTARRLKEYLRLDREAGRHPAATELHRRAAGTRGAARLKEFLRIDRGVTQG